MPLLQGGWTRVLGGVFPLIQGSGWTQGPWHHLQARPSSRPAHHRGEWWVGPSHRMGYPAPGTRRLSCWGCLCLSEPRFLICQLWLRGQAAQRPCLQPGSLAPHQDPPRHTLVEVRRPLTSGTRVGGEPPPSPAARWQPTPKRLLQFTGTPPAHLWNEPSSPPGLCALSPCESVPSAPC